MLNGFVETRIQKLHTIGMLTGSFLPDEATEKGNTNKNNG
jgi:hypothetical protein